VRVSQGDKLYLVKLTDSSKATRADGSRKQSMLITFGEHAREFLPVESFFKLVHDTCKAFSTGQEVSDSPTGVKGACEGRGVYVYVRICICAGW